MNSIILGAAGFIGTNLALELCRDKNNHITLVDRNKEKLDKLQQMCKDRVSIKQCDILREPDLDTVLAGQNMVYHLVSTIVPATSNRNIPQEIRNHVELMCRLLESCIRCQVERIVFLSSGGTVYGIRSQCPLSEEAETFPINSYGVQKVISEKLLYLYHYVYGLDYRIIRLANPFGPYQAPDGVQGAAAVFIYKALRNERVTVYGDGSVVRDYIYIKDAVHAMINIACSECSEKVFNVGSGQGVSVRQLLEAIEQILGKKLKITYMPGRAVDAPVNVLDISRYEHAFGRLNAVPLKEGLQRTFDFMRKETKWNL